MQSYVSKFARNIGGYVRNIARNIMSHPRELVAGGALGLLAACTGGDEEVTNPNYANCGENPYLKMNARIVDDTLHIDKLEVLSNGTLLLPPEADDDSLFYRFEIGDDTYQIPLEGVAFVDLGENFTYPLENIRMRVPYTENSDPFRVLQPATQFSAGETMAVIDGQSYRIMDITHDGETTNKLNLRPKELCK